MRRAAFGDSARAVVDGASVAPQATLDTIAASAESETTRASARRSVWREVEVEGRPAITSAGMGWLFDSETGKG